MSNIFRRELKSDPLSERAYKMPKKYKKAKWLRHYWSEVMTDMRKLCFCPFKAVEKNGNLILFILNVKKFIFVKDGTTKTLSRKYWNNNQKIAYQLSLLNDEIKHEYKSIWRDDSDRNFPLLGMYRDKQYAKCLAMDIIFTAITMMENSTNFAMHKFIYYEDKYEEEDSFMEDIPRYYLPGYPNIDDCDSDIDICTSNMVKYFIRAAKTFFPKFYRTFPDYFDVDIIDILENTGWIGTYSEYKVYREHAKDIRRIASERQNLLPLLDLIWPHYWKLKDLFSARYWAEKQNHFINEQRLCQRMIELKRELSCRMLPVRGPGWQKDISIATWHKIASTPAVCLKAMLVNGLGSLYDFNTFFNFLNIGRKFPWELLPYALEIMTISYAREFFIRNDALYWNYRENNRVEYSVQNEYLRNERIRKSIFRTGQLWFLYHLDKKNYLLHHSKKKKYKFEAILNNAFTYALENPERILDHNVTWKTIERISKHYRARNTYRNRRIDEFDSKSIKENDKDLWWQPLGNIKYNIDGFEIEELCTSNDIYSESLQQRNCLVSYINKCILGQYHVFRLSGPERATLGFALGRQGWYCDELKGFKNSNVTRKTKSCAAHLEMMLSIKN